MVFTSQPRTARTPSTDGRRPYRLAPLAALWLLAHGAAGAAEPPVAVSSTGPAPTATQRADCPPPQHALTLVDGARYCGPLLRGKLHGQGRVQWASGDRYVGHFADGAMSGQGVLTGHGFEYHGQFSQGYMDGRGRLTRGDDWVYEGQLRHGLMQGQGKLTLSDYVYEGTFQKDELTGPGRMTDRNGSVIEGRFKAFQPVGSVKISWPTGDRFEGPVVANTPHGRGVWTRADKAVVRGQFDMGDTTGPATIDYANGSRYTGPVHYRQARGQGELKNADGGTYVGSFSADQPDGPGQLTRPDGSVQTGYWRAGQYLGATGDGTLADTPQLAARNNEAALYNQPALLQAQFDQLLPSSGPAPQIYALYVAGDGQQEVFRREVAYVDELMASRFGTRGRSVSLVNSRSSAERLPLATTHSIEQALQALAQKMNRERDLLFVFLTSHGSRTHELSLDMPRMALPDLPAARLGQLLKATGIRNQVVVVSACYAGGFVPALQGERTWVITAARADRTSFGCADDNEFTYFGRALFKDAIPQAATLSDAFEQARKLVDEWETRDEAKARAEAKAAPATTNGRRARTEAPKVERSEPMSVVAPAFRAEVDGVWRDNAGKSTANTKR